MTHEVTIGQQVDREKEAKEKTKRLIICIVAVNILVFGCLTSCLVFTTIGSNEAKVTSTPAQSGQTAVPTGVYVPRVVTTEANVANATAVPLTATPEGVFAPGTYVVGKDIQPGTYRGQAGNDLFGSCYWARLNGLSGELDDIIANDNAEGQFYIEVKGTDFALETACTIERVDD